MPNDIAPPSSHEQPNLREQSKALLERLIETYPIAFLPLGKSHVQPLKLGIHKELVPIIKEWGYEVAVLRYTLGGYTRQLRYQMALLKNSHRIDLQGEPAGEISEVHRQTAQEKVSLIQEKRRRNRVAASTQIRQRRPQPAAAANGVSEEALVALQKKLTGKTAS